MDFMIFNIETHNSITLLKPSNTSLRNFLIQIIFSVTLHIILSYRIILNKLINESKVITDKSPMKTM